MKYFLPPYIFFIIASGLFLGSCHSTNPANFPQQQPEISGTPSSAAPDTSVPKPIAGQTPEKKSETVAASGKKVKTKVVSVTPESYTQAESNNNASPKKSRLSSWYKKLEDIHDEPDEPVKGPAYTFSGIFLGLGMALLLTALVLAIIGTGGAGTLAIVGGSSFLAGSILAIICLMSV